MIDPAILGEYKDDPIPLRTDQAISIPSLNIFLGSTPAYAALEAMRRVVNLPDVERRRIAFVFIDIDSLPSEVESFIKQHKGKLTIFHLRISVANGASYADALPADRVQHSYIPRKIPQSWDAGAGGIRNNGHVAACTYQREILQALDGALASLRELPPVSGASPVRDILINIVAFLGGGTGSGILPDLMVMARERVTKLMLPHRLNAFCLLPEQFGQTPADDALWRQSNATATLLEIIALSQAKNGLVAQSQSNGRYAASVSAAPANAPVYTKYMFNEPYPIKGTTIAHEVYLYGNTSVKNAVNAARIIGIDLYSRMINGSGVGYLERSKAVDRRRLDAADTVGGIQTMFGASCPLEVMFPGPETALAFALLTAADTLPQLTGTLTASSTISDLSGADKAEIADWTGPFLYPDPKPERFKDSQFKNVSHTKLDRMLTPLQSRIDGARASIAAQAQDLEQREQDKIRSAKNAPHLSDRIAALQARKRVYDKSLENLQTAGRPPRESEIDIEVAFRKLRRTFPLNSLKERAEADLCAAFNRTLGRAFEYTRWDVRVKLLSTLRTAVMQELERDQEAFKDIGDQQIIENMRAQAYASAAWNGRLDEPHIHTRHLFDLPSLSRMNPVERLYDFMRRGNQPDDLAARFLSWMRERYSDELDIVGIQAADLRYRLVEYLRDVVFLPRLQQKNLLDLLAECCVEGTQRTRANAAVEALLYEHLDNLRLLARSLVIVEPQLAANIQEAPAMSLFLGVHFHTGDQKALVESAYEHLDQFDGQGLKPTLAPSFDPHVLQLVYGKHAFSLGTAPDFYQENNSGMAAMLQCQGAWYGDGAMSYGLNQAPVFASGEMERLVMDANALGVMHDLPQRVIRPAQQFAGSHPTWHRQTWNGQSAPPAGGGQGPYTGAPTWNAAQPPDAGPHPYTGQPPYPGQASG